MRFINVLVALGSVAGVVSAFQGVSDRSDLDIADDNAYDSAATTLLPAQIDARDSKKVDKKKTSTTSTKGSKKKTASGIVSTNGGKTTNGDKKKTGKVSTSACRIKKSPKLRFMPRVDEYKKLKKAYKKPETDGSFILLENEWVTANNVKPGVKVSVPNITGCSAVFLWNKDNIPSVFHIFCNAETTEAPDMAQQVNEFPKAQPVFVTIAAKDQRAYNTIKDAIMAELGFDDECNPNGLKGSEFEPMPYNNNARPADQAYKFTAVAGTREVTQSLGPKLSTQPGTP